MIVLLCIFVFPLVRKWDCFRITLAHYSLPGDTVTVTIQIVLLSNPGDTVTVIVTTIRVTALYSDVTP